MTKHIYKHIYSFLLAAAFLFGGAGILSAQEIEWSKVPNSFSYDIRWGSITHGYNNLGQDLFIVFGYDSEHDQDVISTSKDGLNWTTPLNPQSEEDPSQVSWGSAIYSKEKGLFVAVGKGYYDQTGYVMTSEDGESWLINEDAKTENIYWSSVTYGYDDDGDGLFVAVGRTSGDSGVSMTSTNGIAWSDPQVIEGQAELFSVTYSKEKGLFVAAGGYSGNQISTSNDGLNWEIQETPEPFGSAWMSVTYSKEKGLFVAVGYRYSNPTFYGMVMTSEDGKNWSLNDTETENILWSSVAYGNDIFVAVGGDNGYGLANQILISENGEDWESLQEPEGDFWETSVITFGNNMFIALSPRDLLIGKYPDKKIDLSSKSSSIFGTRFCSAGVTTFCRPQNGFTNNNPLISVYTELLGLYQQLLSAMQGQNS